MTPGREALVCSFSRCRRHDHATSIAVAYVTHRLVFHDGRWSARVSVHNGERTSRCTRRTGRRPTRRLHLERPGARLLGPRRARQSAAHLRAADRRGRRDPVPAAHRRRRWRGTVGGKVPRQPPLPRGQPIWLRYPSSASASRGTSITTALAVQWISETGGAAVSARARAWRALRRDRMLFASAVARCRARRRDQHRPADPLEDPRPHERQAASRTRPTEVTASRSARSHSVYNTTREYTDDTGYLRKAPPKGTTKTCSSQAPTARSAVTSCCACSKGAARRSRWRSAERCSRC